MTPTSSVTSISVKRPQVLEFFAGIGLARLGLESAGFSVAWANDLEPSKQQMYEGHFRDSSSHYFLGDIRDATAAQLPSGVDVAWASSPCTDLSLAGGRAGLAGRNSGTFWEFIRLLDEMGERRPKVAVLENVVGLASSHGGDDLVAAIRAFNELGYSVDVLMIDARRFLPQSRTRLFLVALMDPPVDSDLERSDLRPDWLDWVFRESSIKTHRAHLPPPPALLTSGLGAVVEQLDSDDSRWWDLSRTSSFLQSLSEVQRLRVESLMERPEISYRTAYRRTRGDSAVWEVRPDDLAGCLRTARGGSSKQAVVKLGQRQIGVRWMTPIEYARLMGAPDYELSGLRPTQVLFGFGDAVAVPVVDWLAREYLLPALRVDQRFGADSQAVARVS